MNGSNIESFPEKLLAALEGLALTFGQTRSVKLAQGFWMVSQRTIPDEWPEHIVTLAWDYPPCEDVQDLAWGLIAGECDVQWTGRTDRRGQFKIRDLPPGEYKLRYVPFVRDELDIAVLEHLGDHPVQDLLRFALEDSHLSESMRKLAGEALRRLREKQVTIDRMSRMLDQVLEGQYDVSGEAIQPAFVQQSMGRELKYRVSYDIAVDSGEDKLNHADIRVRNEMLEIRQSSRDVPFGVVRVIAKGITDGTIKGTCVIALPRYDEYRAGSVSLAKLLNVASDQKEFDFYTVPARRDNLGSFRISEIEELLETPMVDNDAVLRADVNELLRELERRV